jgi:flagellar protein FlaG
MDIVNTKIGMGIAKESVSVINDKTFAASSLVGFSSGVSQFAKSENFQTTQQVKNADKTLVNLSEQQVSNSDKKRKVNTENADIKVTEVDVNFSQALSNINEQLQINGTNISFIMDNSAEQPVIIVTDKESGNVIRQIPTEEMQKFAEHVKEIESGSQSTLGLVLDRQA